MVATPLRTLAMAEPPSYVTVYAPSATLLTSKVMVPSLALHTVGSVLAKFVAESDPPFVPVTLTVALFAPVEIRVMEAGLVAGAVPSMAMKMAVSNVPVLSAPKVRVALYIPFNVVLR